MHNIKYLMIPGHNNSEPEHWQSYWERELAGAIRVNQRDWSNPVCSEWISTLDKEIRRVKGPKILIAHSLGCIVVVQWAKEHSGDIVGALLVSPPDLESFTDPALVSLAKIFIPVNLNPLPFKSIVIASSNDPYSTLDRMKYLAKHWGSEFENIGPAGHINVESGYGKWIDGLKYLRNLSG